jgi:hypothetical protein
MANFLLQALPQLSTRAPTFSTHYNNESEQAAYADVQKAPVEAQHAALPKRELNHENTYPLNDRIDSGSTMGADNLHTRFPSTTPSLSHRVDSSSVFKSSNMPVRVPSNRPTLSSRSPWDPDDDEFDANVYKDM